MGIDIIDMPNPQVGIQFTCIVGSQQTITAIANINIATKMCKSGS